MNTVTEEDTRNNVAPAALPAALRNRLLAAMQTAAEETADDRGLEQMLRRRFAPAPMAPRMQGRLGVQMYLQAVQERRKWYSFLLHRSGAAAAALVLGIGGTLAFYGSNASAHSPQGLVNRSVLSSSGGDDVIWRQDGTPIRSYDVTYEDAFVLEDEDGMTVMVRVPNRRTVTVEEEVL